jgi:hypothetical protein
MCVCVCACVGVLVSRFIDESVCVEGTVCNRKAMCAHYNVKSAAE